MQLHRPGKLTLQHQHIWIKEPHKTYVTWLTKTFRTENWSNQEANGTTSGMAELRRRRIRG